MRLANDLPEHFEYFQQRDDARGHPGFTPTQKIIATLRQLAYGVGSDMLDEYLQMAKKTGRDSLNHFCKGAQSCLPGMLGSLDCMHVGWAMCHTAWRGQFHQGDHPGPTIVLEAVASQDLWFLHAFFGVAGSNNDLNVIDQSPIFDDLIDGVEPPQAFFANGEHFKYGYYLVDGIYSEWGTLVQAYASPLSDKRKYFTKRQESARKDIERAFGVLKKK
ncbi:uncharacterized protein LOC143591136 [Bidens hawaiensis]|uniref:uncharacterized protein LOC143591136 n=1 Tax=Bidens hawaiensis TaxID=980011 RepID=UPI00404A4F68